ncbi:MAG: hypothetical protein JWP97_1932 [Labilithrix sp.]|nr:hypothetical protein [Labilithrix sp.]
MGPRRTSALARAVAALVALAGPVVAGCERPLVAKDGTLAFQEKGGSGHGASVITANGVEYRDNADLPTPALRRTADEPWRAPIGFIVPKDGRFTQTSRPTVLATQGLAIVLRPSDTRLPSWGGEVLVRVDVIAPAGEGAARWGENVAIILDGDGPDAPDLADAALGQLAGRDRVTVIDTQGAQVVVPMMPASHRSMVVAALKNHLRSRRGPRNMVSALQKGAAAIASPEITQRILVLTESPMSTTDAAEVSKLQQRGVQIGAIKTRGDDLEARLDALRTQIPQAGLTTFRNVKLTFEGTPAPSHVLEVTGGEARWQLDAGELVLGNVRAGEARTEIVRVTVPPWVPGESFRFTVTAHVDDLSWGGPRDFSAEVPCIYDDDIERIAKSRHGDVIAYSSAMATLRRLDEAFVGDGVAKAGGLRRIAEMHASSMKLLARDTKDFAIQEQADLLVALLATTKNDATPPPPAASASVSETPARTPVTASSTR